MSKTIVELEAQARATIEDNTAGAISAADVRNMFLEFLQTMKPASARISLTTPLVMQLTTTPKVIKPYTTIDYIDTPEFVATIVNGSVTRILSNSTSVRTSIIVSGTLEAPSGNDVTVELRRNGVAIGFSAINTGRGTGNYVPFDFGAYGPISTVAGEYALYAYAKATANVTFSNVSLLLEKIPVRETIVKET
jgi:hypothetical protein